MVQSSIAAVTAHIVERSKPTREVYLQRLDAAARRGPRRGVLGCANLAHGFAACGAGDKAALAGDVVPNLGIVTSYNDMLSAHQPYERFPALIKEAARAAGGVAQVAGGVPAMCDGVTPGYGAVAVLARGHRHGHRDRAVARHVRRRGVSRRLRQDRAGPRDRRADLRPSAGGVRAGGADAIRHRQ